MGLLLFLGTGLVAASIAYWCVRFLEPERASIRKAIVFIVLFAVWNASYRKLGIKLPLPFDWLLYFVVTACLVWVVFRLKPIHCVTAGAFYVVVRYVFMYALLSMPKGFWVFFGGSAA